MRGATREGVVIRHNRLTELDLTGTHGSTFVQRARSSCFNNWADGGVIVRIFFRETGMLVHISSWVKDIIHMSEPNEKPDVQ